MCYIYIYIIYESLENSKISRPELYATALAKLMKRHQSQPEIQNTLGVAQEEPQERCLQEEPEVKTL